MCKPTLVFNFCPFVKLNKMTKFRISDFKFFQNFLRDLLTEASKSQEVTEDKLIEYTDTMVSYMNIII